MNPSEAQSRLRNPRQNKSTAFSETERRDFHLEGLLPDAVESLETQITRVEEQINQIELPIHKYSYLCNLLDTNETLFYKTIGSKPAKYMPLVYTPTVGEACEKFGHILRQPRGLFLSLKHKGRIRQILKNWPEHDVKFIVVTDGGRILGLGDLGVNGIGIPIGKLLLYTSCAGVPPEVCLPVVLDVGTNNENLLKDPLYVGIRRKRLEGQEYEAFIEEFVSAANEIFPGVCIQWEDFNGKTAIGILKQYRDKVCTFNDDIQGTAAIALAGFIGISRMLKSPFTEQRFLFLGAGAAAFGIADMLVQKFVKDGLSLEQARQRVRMHDVNGLLVQSRKDLTEYQRVYAHEGDPVLNFADSVLAVKPTAIIGVSTVGGAFNQQVIENMSAINERPVIFPYSNPTSHAECTAEQAYTWSKGKAVFASGSPFPQFTYQGKTFIPGQGNNVFIFPGLGLAIYATQAKRVTDQMLLVAAEAVAEQVKEENFQNGLIYPPVSTIQDVSFHVAVQITKEIYNSGLSSVLEPSDIPSFLKSKMYNPAYI
ncbi:MAG TPA: NAD-dependent malic enzyme [Bacteroidia bacterium]|nr:NAD-dependent malic enzyme [Bacteroidia bacterium]